MKAVITVIGKDSVGIIAKVSGKCSEYGVNILDVTQKVFSDTFAMIMLADIDGCTMPFTKFVDVMKALGKENNLEIRATREDIFDSMHKI